MDMFDCEIMLSIIVGVFTSLFVWYLTNYIMSPTFVVKDDVRFDAIEKEFFIVIQNTSSLFNAYNVMMYCIHYEGNIIKEPQSAKPTKTVAQERQVFRTKETAKVSYIKYWPIYRKIEMRLKVWRYLSSDKIDLGLKM